MTTASCLPDDAVEWCEFEIVWNHTARAYRDAGHNARVKIPSEWCGNRATHWVDGKNCCLEHARVLALEILLET